MPNDSYDLFISQLSDVCAIFPNIRIKERDNKKILKGTINIKNSDNTSNKTYSIEIHWKDGFPYKFPILYEVGEDIPCEADWHKYPDNSCCITVGFEEILECKSGVTVLKFIQKQVIPYLANHWYRKITGKYKNEYSHGNKGLMEFLCDCAFGERKLNIGRNDKCFCGSKLKFKKCCNLLLSKIQELGKENMIQLLNRM